MANFNLNVCMIAGRMVETPELKQTPSGVAVVSFRVAVARRMQETDESGQKVTKSDFFNVVAWRERAEFVCRYFKKGSSIYVSGEMQGRSYTNEQGVTKYYTELIASDVRFVDSKSESEARGTTEPGATVPTAAGYMPQRYAQPASAAPAAAPMQQQMPQFETISDDGELPF